MGQSHDPSTQWAPPPALPSPANSQKNNLGTLALTFGILSVVLLGALSGIPAVILGVKSRRAASRGEATNGGQGTAGLVTGTIGTVGSVMFLILVIAGAAAVGGGAGKSAAAFGSSTASVGSTSDPGAPPSSDTVEAPTPGPGAFVLTPVIKSKECFGSAGCNITYRIKVAYNGDPLPSDAEYEVTYVVRGGDSGPITNTFKMTGTSASVEEEEMASTSSSSVNLRAKATDVEKLS